ncbi:MAG: DUF945 family protein [Gammaproteobacteria bacterium]
MEFPKVTGIKKVWITAGACAAIVFTGAFAAQYWSGAQIEEHFGEFVAMTKRYGYNTEIQSYERGASESKAVTVTSLAFDEATRFELVFDHVMEHGPRLGDSAVARIESTLRLPDGELDQLKQALNGAAPLKVVTLILADGSHIMDLSAPQFEIQDVDGSGDRFLFAGLGGEIKVAPNSTSYTADLNAPTFKLTTSKGEFTASDLTLDAAGVPSGVPSLWLGDADIKIAKMSVNPIQGQELVQVDIDQLSLTTVVESVDAGFNIKGGYAINQVMVGGETVNDIALDMSMGPLDPDAMKQYMDTAVSLQSELSTNAGATLESMGEEIMASATQVLTKGQPAFRFDNISFAYGTGRMDGNLMVRYVGGGDMAAFNPFTDIDASLSLKGTKNMIATIVSEVLAAQQYGDRLANLEEEERNAVVGATQFQLDAVIKQGMLADAGEHYAVDASFTGGELLVNGTPMPLPVAPPPQ